MARPIRIGMAGIIATAALAAAVPAHAGGTTTNTMAAKLNVYSGCSLRTRPLVFLTTAIDAKGNADSTTTITIKCTPNVDYTIDIDKGQNANGINRRMYSALTNSYAAYDIYRDAPRTNVWGTGQLKNVTGNSGSGAAQDIVLYGRVPRILSVISGLDYRDTLTVTLNF